MKENPPIQLLTGEVVTLGQVLHYVHPGSGASAPEYRPPTCGHAEVVALFPAPRHRLVLLRDTETGIELRWSPVIDLSSKNLVKLYAKEEEALSEIRDRLRIDKNTIDKSITSLEDMLLHARERLTEITLLLTHHA